MLMVAMYKGESLHDMKLVSGTADPSVVSQISTIMKNALNDEDKELEADDNEVRQAV